MARTRLTGAAISLVRSFDDLVREHATGRTPRTSQREVFADTDAERPYRTGSNQFVVGRQDAVLLESLARSRTSALSRGLVRRRSDRVQGLLVDLTRELSAPTAHESVSPFSAQGVPLGPSAQTVGRAYADALFPVIADDVRLQELMHSRLHQLWSGPLPGADEQVRLVAAYTDRLSDFAGLRGGDHGPARRGDGPAGPDPLLAAMHHDPRRDKSAVAAERLLASSSVPAVASPEDRVVAANRLANAIGGKFHEAVTAVRGGQPADAAGPVAASETYDEYFRVVREYGVVTETAERAETAETARQDPLDLEIDRWLGTPGSGGGSGAAAGDHVRPPTVGTDRNASRPEHGR